MTNTRIAIQTTRDDHRIAWLTALAIAIHIIESTLPSPLPGIKPGLANVITVAVLMLYGWQTTAWVALLRVLIGSILIGTFLSPTFMLSLSGTVASLLALGLGNLLPRKEPTRGLGPIGFSLLSSMAHMAAQFFVAYLFFIPHDAIFSLLPVLMTASVIFGLISGIIVHMMIKRTRGTS